VPKIKNFKKQLGLKSNQINIYEDQIEILVQKQGPTKYFNLNIMFIKTTVTIKTLILFLREGGKWLDVTYFSVFSSHERCYLKTRLNKNIFF